MKDLKAYFGIGFNALIGWHLLTTEVLDPILYWCLIIAIPVLAALSILSFGVLCLGWTGLMSDKDTKEYAPGSKRAIQMYDTTINMLKGYNRFRFYISFSASVLLMAGISHQGWLWILIFEVLGSAIGYGFIYWALNNTHRMHERTHGK